MLTCVIAGTCAGTIAFGAGQFLPLYFQDSLFVSPTESGLRMLPQMIGVTLGAFGIGRMISADRPIQGVSGDRDLVARRGTRTP